MHSKLHPITDRSRFLDAFCNRSERFMGRGYLSTIILTRNSETKGIYLLAKTFVNIYLNSYLPSEIVFCTLFSRKVISLESCLLLVLI